MTKNQQIGFIAFSLVLMAVVAPMFIFIAMGFAIQVLMAHFWVKHWRHVAIIFFGAFYLFLFAYLIHLIF